MARAAITETILAGNPARPAAGATVTATDRDGDTVTVYDDETDGSAVTQPITVSTTGRLHDYWVSEGPIDLEISYRGDTWTVPFDAVSARGAGFRELGYTEVTAGLSTASNEADVPDLDVTVEVTTRPIVVKLYAQQQGNNSATNFSQSHIQQGSGAAPSSYTTVRDGPLLYTAAAGQAHTSYVETRLSLSPGTYTFKATFGRTGFSSAGTATLTASASNPAYLQVLEI